MTHHTDDHEQTADAAGRPVIRAGAGATTVGAYDLEGVTDALGRVGSLGSDSLSPGNDSALDAESLLDLLDRLRSLTTAVAAVEIRATDALAAAVSRDAHGSGEESESTDRVSTREVSVVSRISPSAASRRMKASRRLVRNLPGVLSALAEGDIDAEKAYAAGQAVAPLDPTQRGEVDQALTARLGELAGAGQRQWRREIEAITQLVDADGEERRHEVARRHRNVTLRARENGMATLAITTTALDASAARARLSLEGEKLRAAGDTRGHSAIMADTAADALVGRSDGVDPVKLDIGVIITDRALFCPQNSEPALIEGYGAVPVSQVSASLRRATQESDSDAGDPDVDGPDAGGAHVDGAQRAKDAALRATLRRLYTHPTSGELVAVESRARAFPHGLSRFLRWRSMTCSGPFCNAEIRHDDHIQPHSRDGATSLDNGNGLCARCNDKENQQLTARPTGSAVGDGRHRVRWRTRYGSTVDVTPTPSELAALLPHRPGPLSSGGTRGTEDPGVAADATEAGQTGQTGQADGPASPERPDRASRCPHRCPEHRGTGTPTEITAVHLHNVQLRLRHSTRDHRRHETWDRVPLRNPGQSPQF
ncbi:DUF222 domain-containing protein [Brachybacterium sp. GCM10030267]|uniref:HNH endonuclease n=1 Tax=Brachybacterium sp. GCM10030267 TaxID=3273381 RepID=UPI00361A8946